MKNEKLNYEAKVLANNGAIAEFEFHADNPVLADDHARHLLTISDSTLIFDWRDILPDSLHHIAYKKKSNLKWKCILKKEIQ